MWAALRVPMQAERLDPVRIENALELGTPDVNYTLGWCELKYVDAWPKRGGPLKIRHYTPQQRAWLLRRRHVGGRVNIVLKVGKEWYLLPVGEATELLYRGEMTRAAATQWFCAGGPGEIAVELSRVSKEVVT